MTERMIGDGVLEGPKSAFELTRAEIGLLPDTEQLQIVFTHVDAILKQEPDIDDDSLLERLLSTGVFEPSIVDFALFARRVQLSEGL